MGWAGGGRGVAAGSDQGRERQRWQERLRGRDTEDKGGRGRDRDKENRDGVRQSWAWGLRVGGPYLSGGSGLRWAPGSPGRGGTMTGTQLHTETRLSPDTRGPAPALGLPVPTCLSAHPSRPKSSAPVPVCIHLSDSHPPGWQLTLAHAIPAPRSLVQMWPFVLVPRPPIATQTLGPVSTQRPMPTCLGAWALLDAAAAAPALTHSAAALLPCHVPSQDVVTCIRSCRVKVALPAPAAHRALPRWAGPAGRG